MSRANLADPWNRKAYASIGGLAHSGELFTSDDVRKLVGNPPDPNQMGAVFADAQTDGLIRYVCHVRSTRKETKGRRVGQWIGASFPLPAPVENPPAQPRLLEVTR